MKNRPYLDLSSIYKTYEHTIPYQKVGKVCSSRGMLYEINLPHAVIGAHVEFVNNFGDRSLGEVVGIDGDKCMAMPYEEISGINSKTCVYLKDLCTTVKISEGMIGRVVDYQGNPIDDKGPIKGAFERRNIYGGTTNPLERPMVNRPLDTGINAINFFCTMGKGQRMAIMAGSGVGKSVLLGMIAGNTDAEINVVALVGERGREVLEFIQSDLGEAGLKKSVIVVATSDTSALIRIKAAYVATTIAEYFRDKNKDVLFMMDSITRFAMACREVSLSAGETPGRRGYSPSVFAKLPRIMERVGTRKGKGTITGIYTVLVEGGDIDEPISDSIRAISDGHIVLNRTLAARNHFPAIDILDSISRVMNKVVSNEHMVLSSYIKDLYAAYKEKEDLIDVGAYGGGNERVDKAIKIHSELETLLKQMHGMSKSITIDEIYEEMLNLVRKVEQEFKSSQTEAKE